MRKMSLDVGTRTIGIAVSDLLGMIANGVETIKRTTEERDFARIGERAQACEAMAHRLEELFPACKVVLWDERLSTVAAEKVLVDADMRRKKRKQVIDMMAAVVILQNYLDSKSFKI